MRIYVAGAVALAVLTLAACTPDAAPVPTVTVTETAHTETTVTFTPTPEVDLNLVPNPYARPASLGTEVLPLTKNGLAKPGETPPELVNRQLEPGPSALPDPDSDEWFVTISPVPDDVLARSSWTKECPVKSTELAYVVMPFWGFDNKPHTGEMLVNAKWAQKVSSVFQKIYEYRFPIEEMRVTTAEEVGGDHFGDQNVTISFECRRTTGGYTTWSAHASGLALDINPFQNPWARNDFIYPELATSYTDRTWLRPGMIETRRDIIADFKKIGWSWGGDWGVFDDWMHFSSNNH
jgi:hypothetical protein